MISVSKQRSPNVYVRGPHKLSHNSSRAGHLTYCVFRVMCYIPPNQLIFRRCTTFSFLTKWLRGPDEMVGFGPQAVVWRPCFKGIGK